MAGKDVIEKYLEEMISIQEASSMNFGPKEAISSKKSLMSAGKKMQALGKSLKAVVHGANSSSVADIQNDLLTVVDFLEGCSDLAILKSKDARIADTLRDAADTAEDINDILDDALPNIIEKLMERVWVLENAINKNIGKLDLKKLGDAFKRQSTLEPNQY